MKNFNNHNLAVGMFFRKLRKERDLTQLNVAEGTGKTKAWYVDIERGKNSIFFNDAKLLCDFFGVKVSDLSDFVDKILEENLN